MNILRKGVGVFLALPLAGGLLPLAAHADPEPQCFFESRSGVNVECGIYKGEVSISKAYVDTVVNRKPWRWKSPKQAVLLDVRSVTEYKAGHPENSYNVPYPYIYRECDDQGRQPDGACKTRTVVFELKQDVDEFVEYVKKIVPNKHTPIYTLCRTGVRSVGAANRLTEAGYKNVYNIWEGFVGVNLKAPQENDKGEIVDLPVDLDHDGKLTDIDKNGWKHHGGLPYTKRLLPHLIYHPQVQYYWYD